MEKPRTDDEGTTAEGRELPEIQPEVPTAPDAVVDAPESTTPKVQQEDPTKLDPQRFAMWLEIDVLEATKGWRIRRT